MKRDMQKRPIHIKRDQYNRKGYVNMKRHLQKTCIHIESLRYVWKRSMVSQRKRVVCVKRGLWCVKRGLLHVSTLSKEGYYMSAHPRQISLDAPESCNVPKRGLWFVKRGLHRVKRVLSRVKRGLSRVKRGLLCVKRGPLHVSTPKTDVMRHSVVMQCVRKRPVVCQKRPIIHIKNKQKHT